MSHSYFSVSTSKRPHGFSFVMCRNSPVSNDKAEWTLGLPEDPVHSSHPFCWRRPASIFQKPRCVLGYHPKVRLCEPSGPRPSNNPRQSAARTGSHQSQARTPSRSNKKYHQRLRVGQLSNDRQHTMQAVLQISAGVPYPAPSKTSRQRYCLVWISSVKWWCYSTKRKTVSAIESHTNFFSLTTQQALPKSAIFTNMSGQTSRTGSGLLSSNDRWSGTEDVRRIPLSPASVGNKLIPALAATKGSKHHAYWSNSRCRLDYPEG